LKKTFGKLNPDKIKFWDNKKNNGLSPFDISPFSHKKYHWICKKEHEQKISIRMRIKNNGCKRCN